MTQEVKEKKISRIEKFLDKAETVELEGEKIVVKQLGVENIDLAMAMTKESTRGRATKKVMIGILKDNFPEATDDQINRFGLKYAQELIPVIIRVNGMTVVANNESEGQSRQDNS